MATITLPEPKKITQLFEEAADGKYEGTLFRGGMIVLAVVAVGIVLRDVLTGDGKKWD